MISFGSAAVKAKKTESKKGLVTLASKEYNCREIPPLGLAGSEGWAGVRFCIGGGDLGG